MKKLLDTFKDINTNSITKNICDKMRQLLKKDCNIILSNLKCSFSFYIVIENNLGHKYRCPIYLTIPLSNGTSSIYNGSFYYTYNPDYYFYLYT